MENFFDAHKGLATKSIYGKQKLNAEMNEYPNNNSIESESSQQSIIQSSNDMDGVSIGGCRVKIQSQVGYNHIKNIYTLRLKVTDMIMYKGNNFLKYPQKIDVLLSHDVFEKFIKPKNLKECLLFYNSSKHGSQEVELSDMKDYVIITKDGESLPSFSFYTASLSPKAYEFFFEFRLKFLLQHWSKENDICTPKPITTISNCPRKGTSSILVQILHKIQNSRKRILRVWDGSVFKKGTLVKTSSNEELPKLGFITNDNIPEMKDANNFGTESCKYSIDIGIPQKSLYDIWDKTKPGDWILLKCVSSFETYKHIVKFFIQDELQKEDSIKVYNFPDFSPLPKHLNAMAFAIQRKPLYFNCLRISLNIFDIKNFCDNIYDDMKITSQGSYDNESLPIINNTFSSEELINNCLNESTNILTKYFKSLDDPPIPAEIQESKSPKSSSCSLLSIQSTTKEKKFYGVDEIRNGTMIFVKNYKNQLLEELKLIDSQSITINLSYSLVSTGKTSINISMEPENIRNNFILELLYRSISDIFENKLSSFKAEAFSKGNGGNFKYEIIFKIKDNNINNPIEIIINFDANIKKVTTIHFDINNDVEEFPHSNEPEKKKMKL
uniref:Protection of telomeres protein 1 n=1 Tax=Parastrongyloides trichosuri TaxID=131310 RepID=A0A0N4Z712_PARTI